MDNNTVSVIGVGYIGLPLTAALANVGYKVIGVDINEKRVSQLSSTYTADLYEPGLNDTLNNNRDSIEFTTDFGYALGKAHAVFITVGTPLTEDDRPDFSHIDSAIATIGPNIRKGHIIILKSTVVLGTTENHVRKELEKTSGLVAGKDFFLAFCPERTIEGKALEELYSLPKIVGGINVESTEKAANVIKKLGSEVHKVSSPKVAEMCKLIDNLYRAVNIALANEVGMVCEGIGIDANEVVATVNRSYERTHLFRPGLGADGPCLSKDPMIFRHSANLVGAPSPVTAGTIEMNRESTLRIAEMALSHVRNIKAEKPTIAFIGLAFKGYPETDDLRGAPSVKIYEVIKKELPGAIYRFYDPVIDDFLGMPTVKSLSQAMSKADVAMFLTDHKKIMDIDASSIVPSGQMLIIDCWGNIVNRNGKKAQVTIFRVGRGKE